MTTINLFQFEGQQVRHVVLDGEPWFVARDVARVLGYSEPGRAIRQHCKGGANHTPLQTEGGTQQARIIAEPDVFRLIVSSKLPAAERFEKWLFEEVLPQIRRTGAYGTQAALSEDEIVHQALAITARRVEQLEAKITADAPKVHFAEAVAASPSTILVGDLAKILRANGAPFGANRLFEKLRADGYLIRRRGSDWNMPTQKSMELGLFEIKESTRQHPDGHVLLTKTPKVTGKGQQYFIEKYTPRNQLDLGRAAA
ncbi:phage antirepressor [Leucobacter massiliensis]|uniref:Bro-N domain-containing protein n=1 Tax=Leucobacter massiliensis TaxID=1686285 RepID=A0A2S9QMY7_9MICO|nr:phage antirepressor [Leucobacter massiliensis]PRI10954.1 hypothetical protein B4915_08705 [Leucobacter massiliensis]